MFQKIFQNITEADKWCPFFTKKPSFFIELTKKDLHKKGQKLYEYQLAQLANALLLEDKEYEYDIDRCYFDGTSIYKFFPEGSLVSGSFLMSVVASNVSHGSTLHGYDDIDIYFKSKEDAKLFLHENNITGAYWGEFDFHGTICSYGTHNGIKMNLIYGVPYKDAGDLISHFDIRACSMALDINKKELYVIQGAIQDATLSEINFNPVPRAVTVRRLTKYIQKGFNIKDYQQSLFFVELLKSNIYNSDLEQHTKQY